MRHRDLLEGVAAVQGRDERTSSRAALSQERDSLTTNLPPCKDCGPGTGAPEVRLGGGGLHLLAAAELITQLCLESDWGDLP